MNASPFVIPNNSVIPYNLGKSIMFIDKKILFVLKIVQYRCINQEFLL